MLLNLLSYSLSMEVIAHFELIIMEKRCILNLESEIETQRLFFFVGESTAENLSIRDSFPAHGIEKLSKN